MREGTADLSDRFQLTIPLDKGGIFQTVFETSSLHIGPMGTSETETTLLEHLHYEEYQLPSLTRGDDAKAERATEIMRQEHQAQRDLLDRVIRDLDETAVGVKLLVGVRELSRAVKDDMEHEERELLRKL